MQWTEVNLFCESLKVTNVRMLVEIPKCSLNVGVFPPSCQEVGRGGVAFLHAASLSFAQIPPEFQRQAVKNQPKACSPKFPSRSASAASLEFVSSPFPVSGLWRWLVR